MKKKSKFTKMLEVKQVFIFELILFLVKVMYDQLLIYVVDYFSKARIISELETTKSFIYKAILKYDYSNFKLDILEICSIESLLEK